MLAIYSDAFRPKLDGVSVSLENMVLQFDKMHYPYHLYVPKTPGNYEDNDRTFRFMSLPLLFQPEVRMSVPVDVRNLRQILRCNYTHIHSQAPGPLGMLAESVAEIRSLPHFHTFHTFFPDYTHYVFKGQIVSPDTVTRLSCLWANRMDYLTVPSTKVKNWLVNNGVTVPIEVIPNGIDPERFHPRKEGKGSYLVEKGLVDEGDKVLLFVGRVAKEKSIDRLIRYFAKAFSRLNFATKLVIIGDGPDSRHLKQFAKDCGVSQAVVFGGYVDPIEIPEVYQSADVFALMSTSETQGMVVAEALSSGVPVIVADDEAYSDTVVEGRNGFYVKDETDFVTALINLLDPSHVREFSHRAFESSKSLTLDKTVRSLLDYYEYGLAEWKHADGGEINTKVPLVQVRKRVQSFIHELREIVSRDNV